MKMERMRNGLELFNKVDGCNYKVVEVLNNTEGLAVKKNPEDDSLMENSGVVINESNCLAFRIIADPEPYPVPQGYTAENGVLMTPNGAPACEQGNIVVESILAALPGTLILNAKPTVQREGRFDIFAYDVTRDRFKRLVSCTPALTLIGYVGAKAVVAYSKTDEVKNEDGEAKTVFDEARMYEITSGGIGNVKDFDRPIMTEDALIAINGEYYEVYMPCDQTVDCDGVVQESGKREWLRVPKYSEPDEETIPMEGKIKADWSPTYECFVLHNHEAVYVIGTDLWLKSKEAAAVVNQHPILIDITKDGYDLRVTFSNEKYEMKTIVSKSTKDRGYIVTVG